MARKSSDRKLTQHSDETPSGVLARTLGVIELLAENVPGMPLFEIAERLGIPRSATHRLLTSLTEHGYVHQQRQQGIYRLTAKLTSLAFTYLARSGVTDFAQPVLDRLATESGELVRLAAINGKDLVWVAKAQGSPHGLRYDPDMGQVARLSCSASGHAWLACLSDEEALSLVKSQGFGSRSDYGPRAPETEEALLKYLRKARKHGFSIVVETYTPWTNAIAAPIRHPQTQEVSSVVVIAGPSVRFTEEWMLAMSSSLVKAAQELSMTPTASALVAKRSARPAA